MKKLGNESTDDCSVYGEHVAFKLRSYDTRTRAIVQQQINNILFNADMGMYSQFNPYRNVNNPNFAKDFIVSTSYEGVQHSSTSPSSASTSSGTTAHYSNIMETSEPTENENEYA